MTTARNPRIAAWAAALAISLSAACTKSVESGPLAARVTAFVTAYNARDAAAMMTMVTEDVRWLSVDGATVYIEATGRPALEAAMLGFFAGDPRPPSRMRIVREDGNYVFGVEEIVRDRAHVNGNQCSVVVYEFEAESISKVWYYPAYAC